MAKKHKLAILDIYPVHYRIPIYKKLARHPEIELTVYFCSGSSLKKSYNELYNKRIDWGLSLEGINYYVLKNYYPFKKKPHPPRGLINPGILNEIKKNNYDAFLIYGYSAFTNKLVLFSSSLLNTRVIFRDEIDFLKQSRGFKGSLKNMIYNMLWKIPDAFLYSYSLNADFYKHYGVKKEQLFFHPCAVDNEYFQKEAKKMRGKKNEIKKNLGIPKDNKVINFTGRIIDIKRPFDIIYAYEKLQKKIKNKTSIIFIGEGDKKKELEEYVKKKRLSNIKFFGFKKPSEISKYYFISDLFIVSSEEDRSPKAMNEAMNFSIPIITTDRVATARDMINPGKNGFIYNLGDIDKLTEYIEMILESRSKEKELGEEALKTVLNWNFDRDIQGIIDAIKYVKKNKNE